MTGPLTWLLWTLGGLIALAGLVLTLHALFADRARGRPRCPKCWYDMGGLREGALTCPECGRTVKSERRLRKTRRRWRRAGAGAFVLMLGLAAAFYPVWWAWTDVDVMPPTLLALSYPVLGDAAQDRAYARLVDLGAIRPILLSFKAPERKLSPFAMQRLARIAVQRVEDERLSAADRQAALLDLGFLDMAGLAVRSDLLRIALDEANPQRFLAGMLLLNLADDEESMLRTRRALAERGDPEIALIASQISSEVLGVDWQIRSDWSFVAARLERASPEERAAWLQAAIDLVAESDVPAPDEMITDLIELFDRFDLRTDRLRTELTGDAR